MDLLFITHALNGLLMVALPIALGVYLTRRFHLGWRLWLIGAATFILSQVGHIPFNQLLTTLFQNHTLPAPPAAWKPFFNPVVLGLSAGLWEELSRAAVYKFWAKDARSWRKGILMGAGHGGVEAIILGLLVIVAFINMAAIRNADLSQLVPASQLTIAQQQVAAYWSAAWPMTLMGAVERIFTIPVQISLSVMVLQAFTRKKPLWIVVAILWHALLDAAAVYFSSQWAAAPWGVYAIEGVIGLLSLASIAFLFLLRRPEPPEPEAVLTPPPPMLSVDQIQLEVTQENLDKSRYV